MAGDAGFTLGGVVVQNNDQLEAQALEAEQQRQDAEGQRLDALSTHLQKLWQEAKTSKSAIELELLKDLRQRNGEYENDLKAKIAASGGSDIYDEITEQLCAAGVAWMQDLLLYQPDEKPYSVKATPIPALPPPVMSRILAQVATEVAQLEQAGGTVPPAQIEEYRELLLKSITQAIKEESTERAARMSDRIDDIMAESRWEEALKSFLEDFMTFRAAFIERTVQKVSELEFSDLGGVTTASVIEKEKIVFESFSPFDAYPSNDATRPGDGFFFRRVFLSRADVKAMKGMDGYSDANIDYVVANWSSGKSTNTAAIDGERARLEGKQDPANPHGDNMEALKFWGSVTGKMLNEWSPDQPIEVDGQPIAEDQDYKVSAIYIGTKAIKAKLNPDPLGRVPIYKSCYRNIAGAFWGKGISVLLRNSQSEINQLSRSKVNNTGFAAMPMMAIDQSKLPPGLPVSKLYPGCVITIENRAGQGGQIIEFYQPQLIAPQLETMLQAAYRRAEDRAGIPPYQYGQQQTAGAGSTLGGLSILMNSSSRGIKSAIGNIDSDVIKPVIRDIWVHLMIFDPDESIKGDVEIKANGAMAQFSKEQITLRRIELMNATNNPIDSQIKGILGRAKELREAYKATGLDPTGIVPEDDELKAQMQPPTAPLPRNGPTQGATPAPEGAPQ
jgi:hypothetical protein